MAEGQLDEALEKLNQGIEESRQMVQRQTMELAQEYFSDSVEVMRRQIKESRSTLEKLPEQIPGSDEGAFKTLFQALMDSYTEIEEALEAAEKQVSDLEPERIREQGELDATDAARREASKLGVDLTEVKGTGTGGRIIISDVMEAAERNARDKAEELGVDIEEVKGSGFNGFVTAEDVTAFAESAGQKTGEATEEVTGEENGSEEQGPRATNAALRKAEELGVDLGKIRGTGADGLITVKDVVKA